jgi:phage FluMu gp28-like protein
MWVSPVYSQSRKVFVDLVKAIQHSDLADEINKTNLTIKFINGSVIHFKSAERADTLRGMTLDYLIVDEAAFVKDNVWNLVLKPTILVKGKKVLFISTPKGKNYLYTLALRGQDDEQKQYLWIKGTSYDTPFISKEELDEARSTLPEDIYRQEILGEFIDSGGEVFKHLDKFCVLTHFTPKIQGIKYYAGVDFGRQNDYTALTIFDDKGNVVYAWRERQKPWKEIMDHLISKLKEYDAQVQVEVNSIGDVLYEELEKKWNKVEAFVTTNTSKSEIIEELIYGLNEGEIKLPTKDVYTPLYNELGSYSYEYSLKTRKVKYGAIEGAHDDTVMSLAIAYNTFKKRKSKGTYYVY